MVSYLVKHRDTFTSLTPLMSSLPPNVILCHFHPLSLFTTYFPKMHLNVILPPPTLIL